MKVNEAPEKLYLLPNGLISYCRNTDEDVEYTSTNAFIERAKEWFIKHINVSQNIETNENGEPLADSYIKYAESRLNAANEIFEDFIKYVKGK